MSECAVNVLHRYRVCSECADERLLAASARAEALERERDEALYARNLLAICHGDGGHYTTEHGIRKATDDAILKRADLLRRLDSAERALSEYRDANPPAGSSADKRMFSEWRARAEAAEHNLSEDRAALKSIRGALVDAGCSVGPQEGWADLVRGLAGERDALALSARDSALAKMTEYRDAWKQRAAEESNTRLLLSEDGLRLKVRAEAAEGLLREIQRVNRKHSTLTFLSRELSERIDAHLGKGGA